MRAAQAEYQGTHFRLPSAAPLHCPIVLPLAPSVLPLKRPCSLSRPGTAISNPKFGVYIIYALHYKKQCTIPPEEDHMYVCMYVCMCLSLTSKNILDDHVQPINRPSFILSEKELPSKQSTHSLTHSLTQPFHPSLPPKQLTTETETETS